jgi:hypothetical protein
MRSTLAVFGALHGLPNGLARIQTDELYPTAIITQKTN